jgi:hypothetical protein
MHKPSIFHQYAIKLSNIAEKAKLKYISAYTVSKGFEECETVENCIYRHA